MRKSSYIIALLLLSISTLNAQTEKTKSKNSSGKNFIKLNLTGIPFNNYAAQYERVLTKKISLAVSFRTMPSSKIPFRNQFIN